MDECVGTALGLVYGIPGYPCAHRDAIAPIEIKLCDVVGMGLKPYEVRPVQIAWHEVFWKAGGTSMFLMANKGEYGWNAWATRDATVATLKTWKKGYRIADCFPIMRSGMLLEEALFRYVERYADRGAHY